METLHAVTEADSISIQEFVYNSVDREFIKDIKLVWNNAARRNANMWEALAIQFRDDLTQAELIGLAVDLRAAEYQGMQGAYHIFWFD